MAWDSGETPVNDTWTDGRVVENPWVNTPALLGSKGIAGYAIAGFAVAGATYAGWAKEEAISG